jgi:hypothetical protein
VASTSEPASAIHPRILPKDTVDSPTAVFVDGSQEPLLLSAIRRARGSADDET